MKVRILQHVAFEGVGSMADWFEDRRAQVRYTRFFESSNLPELDSMDLLIVMGGPMSVNDEDVYPWLISEKSFIKQAIDAGIPVLGICLGAQLIASALGAKVYPNPEKEIGWFPIEAVGAANSFIFPPQVDAFHWHGETFDLPAGAVRIASSQACDNQAFQHGEKVIALQFHLETTPETAALMLSYCGDELVAGKYIQSEQEIAASSETKYLEINKLMRKVLDYLMR